MFRFLMTLFAISCVLIPAQSHADPAPRPLNICVKVKGAHLFDRSPKKAALKARVRLRIVVAQKKGQMGLQDLTLFVPVSIENEKACVKQTMIVNLGSNPVVDVENTTLIINEQIIFAGHKQGDKGIRTGEELSLVNNPDIYIGDVVAAGKDGRLTMEQAFQVELEFDRHQQLVKTDSRMDDEISLKREGIAFSERKPTNDKPLLKATTLRRG